MTELCWNLGDGVNQAADFSWLATSSPSRNVTPRTSFSQLILSLEAPPVFRRRYDELENHDPRRVLRERAFHMNRAMPNRCKGAFDRVRRARMRPVLSGEIEEHQQRVAILEQAFDGFVVFGRVFLGEDRRRGFGRSAVLGKPDFA
jgi:hypothetical protein